MHISCVLVSCVRVSALWSVCTFVLGASFVCCCVFRVWVFVVYLMCIIWFCCWLFRGGCFVSLDLHLHVRQLVWLFSLSLTHLNTYVYKYIWYIHIINRFFIEVTYSNDVYTHNTRTFSWRHILKVSRGGWVKGVYIRDEGTAMGLHTFVLVSRHNAIIISKITYNSFYTVSILSVWSTRKVAALFSVLCIYYIYIH